MDAGIIPKDSRWQAMYLKFSSGVRGQRVIASLSNSIIMYEELIKIRYEEQCRVITGEHGSRGQLTQRNNYSN